MSLAKQGLLLVGIFLLYEIGFIGTLAVLLSQAETEAAREEFVRELGSKSDRLMLILYDRGDAVGRYARSLQIGASDQSDASVDEVSSLLAWLKEAFKDNQRAEALVQQIDQQVETCLPLHKEISSESAVNGKQLSHREWSQKTEVVQPIINQLVKEVPALVKMAHEASNYDPEAEREKRQLTEKIVLFGFALNVLIVLLIAYLFSKRITSRLELLTDNTTKLKQGQNLRPLIGGGDEIASVDAVFHETAEQLRLELELLKESESRIRSLIESLPIGIVLIDTKGAMELVNESVERTFKTASHHLLGKRLARLFVPGQPVVEGAPHSQQSQIAFKHSVDLQAVDADGITIPVEFMMTEIRLEGESKTLAMIVDATEKFKIKKMRQEFVFMVRSELKEPLTRVSMFMNRFASGALGEVSEQCKTMSVSMEQNIERLIVLLNDLFDLDKLESGEIEIDCSEVSLKSVLERAESAVSMFAVKHNVVLQVSKEDVLMMVDANRIVQVLVNLASNAIKFSPPKSVVRIDAKIASNTVRLEVIDKGAGIPSDQLDAIFEAYRQVEGQDLKKGGTGLGLAICKTIIEAHGGTIGVASTVGAGSTFWFELPLKPGEAGPAHE